MASSDADDVVAVRSRTIVRAMPRSARERRDPLLELMPSDAVCAEIGVHLGDFSERILTFTRPRVLHLIDP
jgi:hypothetical protein